MAKQKGIVNFLKKGIVNFLKKLKPNQKRTSVSRCVGRENWRLMKPSTDNVDDQTSDDECIYENMDLHDDFLAHHCPPSDIYMDLNSSTRCKEQCSPLFIFGNDQHIGELTDIGQDRLRIKTESSEANETLNDGYSRPTNFWDLRNLEEEQHGITALTATSSFIRIDGCYDSIDCKTLVKAFNGSNANGDLFKYITLQRVPALIKEGNVQDLLELLKCKDSSIKLYIAEELQDYMIKSLSLQTVPEIKTRPTIQQIPWILQTLFDEILKLSGDQKVLETLIYLTFSIFGFYFDVMDKEGTDCIADFKTIYKDRLDGIDLPGIHRENIYIVKSFFDDIINCKSFKCYLRAVDWKRALSDPKTNDDFINSYSKFPLREKISYIFLLTAVAWNGHNNSITVRYLRDVMLQIHHDDNGHILRSYIQMLVVRLLTINQYESKYCHPSNLEDNSVGFLAEMLDRGSSFKVFPYNNQLLYTVLLENRDPTKLIFRFLEENSLKLGLVVKDIETRAGTYEMPWKKMSCVQTECQLFGECGKIRVLIPSKENKAQPLNDGLSRNFMHQLDILKTLHQSDQKHENIVHLMLFQLNSCPCFYITEGKGTYLHQFLLDKREQEVLIPESALIEIILQIANAVDYLHDKAIVHRDITAKSFEVHVFEKHRIVIKMHDFSLAKHLWREGDNPRRMINDPECTKIPLLWTAPESLMHSQFDRHSDTWMVCVTAFEIFTQGKWPIIQPEETSLSKVMENVVYNKRRPEQPICMTTPVYKILRDGLNHKPEQRKSLDEMKSCLLTQKAYFGPYRRYTATKTKMVELLTPLTNRQICNNSEPDRFIPDIFMQRSQEGDDDPEELYMDSKIKECRMPIVKVQKSDIFSRFHAIPSIQDDGTISFEEKVDDNFSNEDLQAQKEKLNMQKLGVLKWPSKVNTRNGSTYLKYTCEPGMPLIDIVKNQKYGVSIEGYIWILLHLAYLLKYIHNQNWTVNSLRANNVWVKDDRNSRDTGESEVYIPQLGRFSMIPDGNGHYDFVNQIQDMGMFHWYSPEAIRSGFFSKENDIYSFGRVAYEITAMLQASKKFRDLDVVELVSTPFAQVPNDQILEHIEQQWIPPKNESCPDWLYKNIIAHCSCIERHDRPSLDNIIEELEYRNSCYEGQPQAMPPYERVNPENTHVTQYTNVVRFRRPRKRPTILDKTTIKNFETSHNDSTSTLSKSSNISESIQFENESTVDEWE